jgi:predicted DNA-binding helix-hairpin-helix protein
MDKQSLPGVYQAETPHGTCSLMKVLYTNKCTHDCRYCTNSSSCEKNPASFQPQELADAFMSYVKQGIVEGLFLSSAVPGDPDRIAEKIIETAEIIRFKYNFRGYMHLKALPGISRDNIKRICSLAQRVSLNLESPTKTHFSELTSTKVFATDLMRRMSWLTKHKPSAGVTTQFVVGASEETDRDVIHAMNRLYAKFNLRRIYFSAFDPVPGTPLEKHPAAPSRREFRLYQTDWLLRVYKFSYKSLLPILTESGFLPLNSDPKLAWALQNPDNFPVDINKASSEELLKVPGIGPRTVDKIIKSRKQRSGFRSFSELGFIKKNSFPFIQVSGNRQLQLSNFNHI